MPTITILKPIPKSSKVRATKRGCNSNMNGGGGGGCVARYSGGGLGKITYGMSKVERIMLKFRPIAPKPVSTGSGSSCSTVEQSEGSGGTQRRKRKYVRANHNKKKKDTNTVSKKQKAVSATSSAGGDKDKVVTLSLMPETPERKESSPTTSSVIINHDPLSSIHTTNRNKPSTILLSFNNFQQTPCHGHVTVTDTVMTPAPTPSPLPPQQKKVVVTTLVTVESVTETWMNSNGVGLITDQARVMSMEIDTCPSFITNSRDTVVWTNKAYRKMISGSDHPEKTVMVVVNKFNRVTLPVSHPAFTCTVKVSWGTERGMSSPLTVTAPCDVWRLRNGGCAWRLDVKAALCLGRYS